MRYTRPVSTTVTVNAGETLGVDGTIIVAPSVLNTNQVITGGMLTGANGGDLGVQQNSTGNFTIASQIVDNGTPHGLRQGRHRPGHPDQRHQHLHRRHHRGAGHAVGRQHRQRRRGQQHRRVHRCIRPTWQLEGATLSYTGASDTSDRGFTFAKSGAILGSGMQVTNAAANLTFSGLVTSPDDADVHQERAPAR